MMKPIVMVSDFGTGAQGVPAMKGVCKAVDPALQLFDLCHDIPPMDVEAGRAMGCVTEIMEPFGNLETNIKIDDFEKTGITQGNIVRVIIKNNDELVFDKAMLFHRSFGYAPAGGEICYNSSSGYMGIAMNQHNFAKTYGIGSGPDWSVEILKVN